MDMINNYEPNSWFIYEKLDPSQKFKEILNKKKNSEDIIKKEELNYSRSMKGGNDIKYNMKSINNKYILYLVNKSLKYYSR